MPVERVLGGIAAFVCCPGALLALGTLIGAVLLRAGCGLFNRFVGGPRSLTSVPEPELGKAMGITFVSIVSSVTVALGLGLLFGAWGPWAEPDRPERIILTELVSVPAHILIVALLLPLLLPTTFGRGMLVALCYLLVLIFVAVVITIIFGGLILILSLASNG